MHNPTPAMEGSPSVNLMRELAEAREQLLKMIMVEVQWVIDKLIEQVAAKVDHVVWRVGVRCRHGKSRGVRM